MFSSLFPIRVIHFFPRNFLQKWIFLFFYQRNFQCGWSTIFPDLGISGSSRSTFFRLPGNPKTKIQFISSFRKTRRGKFILFLLFWNQGTANSIYFNVSENRKPPIQFISSFLKMRRDNSKNFMVSGN